MVSGQQKLDLSLLRRRHDPSATSSASFSPTVPTLESPVSFQALAVRAISDTTMAQRNKLDRPPAKPSMFIEETDDDDSMAPKSNHGTPADPKSVDAIHKSVEEEPMRRAKSQYFDDFFSTRGRELSLRDRLSQRSVIVAELKLSKTVTDDKALALAISSRLAQIYQKDESSMMVTIQQDVCIRFGISKDPAYLLKVYALPCLIASITNLRCTGMIQSALRGLLQIEPNHGVVLYLPVPEENFGTNGVTYMGEIARYERRTDDDDPGILRNISRGLSRRLKSSSTQSAPRSEATTSSWGPETDTQMSISARGNDSLHSEGSREVEASSQGNIRGSKSLRHFLSRRVQNPTGGVDDKR
ncbi:MIF domain protein [Aspergillus pseudocaelatus]|uniref:L-dopachrome isomerase n=1 Tax=Aspergillus pseudocaelatus TaxID=1825620 RepID=A0ABQ6WQ55_9EURO|nr:MIF domain protein [Aspergillus pseudocaelatus]